MENNYIYHGTPKCLNNLIPGAFVDDAPTGGHAGCLGVSFSTEKTVCLNFALCGYNIGYLHRCKLDEFIIVDSDKNDADEFSQTEVEELLASGVDGVKLVNSFKKGGEYEIVIFNYKKITIDATMKLYASDYKKYYDAWKR